MSTASSVGVLIGVAIIVLAGVGLLRFRTPYARIHAAGKASPVAFIVVAAAASLELGWSGAAPLAIGVWALLLTLPLAVHMLFRAVHASSPELDPPVDEMRPAGGARDRPPARAADGLSAGRSTRPAEEQ